MGGLHSWPALRRVTLRVALLTCALVLPDVASGQTCSGTYLSLIPKPPGADEGPTSAYETGYDYQGCGRKPSDTTVAGCGCGTEVIAGVTKCKVPCYRLAKYTCKDGTFFESTGSCAIGPPRATYVSN